MNRLRTGPLPVVQLRDALRSPLDALPDAELLDRFANYADYAAFEALLRRHGPMVFGVCRRALGNAPDADDAFQATFLVFIRKARTIGRADRLGPWLYGVACRVALKARTRAARLAAYRSEDAGMIPDPISPAGTPDWLPILDAELAALPAKYRDALVLCELQGVSRTDAAKALGVPEGTLSSRLSRGRDLLRRRLLKHGTLLPAGGLAALFGADNVGRATVPAALLTKTLELSKLGTGAASAGAVPVGTARLTDEVLKSMFLTKLRALAGAFVAIALVAVGTAAVLPGTAPAAPEEQGVAKASAPPMMALPAAVQQPAPAKPAAAKGSDREAIQGLWVLEKCEASKGVPADAARETKEVAGRMRFFAAGDVWWGMVSGPGGNVFPQSVKLDAAKNPKWIDFVPLDPVGGPLSKCVYELDGDRLRLCMAFSDEQARPAEFSTDTDVPLMVMEFRRDKLPPAAGAKELVGSWRVPPQAVGGTDPAKADDILPPDRVEVFDGFLFAFVGPDSNPTGQWIGGAYTVDATKNPKWIDVDLVSPFEADKQTKLYGSYEVADGRLKLALGKKRATRPLEFKKADDVIVLDLSATTVPLTPSGKGKPAADRRGEFDRLLGAGELAAAEKCLRDSPSGRWKVEARTQLAHAHLARAGDSTPRTAAKLYDEAEAAFQTAAAEAAKLPAGDKDAARLRWEAELGRLVVLQYARKADDLMTAATALLDRHRGTVEELVVLLMVRQAHLQRQETDKAAEIDGRVKALYAKFPDSAFPEKAGHFSRNFWQTQGYDDMRGTAAPMPKAVATAPNADEAVRKLMTAGDFAAAEDLLRRRLPTRTKLDLAHDQLMLGTCVLERARAAQPPEASKLLDEAWTLFGSAAGEAARPPLQNEQTIWLTTQAHLRGLQVLQQQRKSDRLLAAATALLDKHRGTVEELILLSLVYHAHGQKQETEQALATRVKMKEVFDRLPAVAFTAEKGEFSREYWVKEWFAAEKVPHPGPVKP